MFAILWIVGMYGFNALGTMANVGERKQPFRAPQVAVSTLFSGITVGCFWNLYSGSYILIPLVATIVIVVALLIMIFRIGKPRRPPFYSTGDAVLSTVISMAFMLSALLLYIN